MDVESRYKKLIESAKTYSAEGKLVEAIHAFEEANKIHETDKTKRRIKILQDALEDSDEDENFVKLESGLIIFKDFAERLYPHQHDGVNWLYNLHKTGAKGGLLADDMGLGKTIQIIAYLSAVFDMGLIKSVLLVLPLSLIENWMKEFKKWAPGINIRCFHGTKAERNQGLKFVQRHPGVLITTYGLIVTQWESLSKNMMGSEFVWDYTILDEGHRIKNPTKTTKAIHAIPSRHRVILTGTPVQNNLKELWSLYDWVMQGTLLGRRKTFQMEFETPILASRKKGASPGEIAYGLKIAENLRKIIDPYMLRRTKASVQKVKTEENGTVSESKGPSFPKLKKKTDLVIWTYISKAQAEIYKAFVEQESVKELLMTKRSPLVELVQMKKICDHPRLLSRRCCKELGLEANDSLNDSQLMGSMNDECAANRINNISDETLISESGKLKFLIELLDGLKEQGHRALVFSRSKKILNIVERILTNRRFKLIRLDGSITKIEERNRRVQAFQRDASYDVFLLTVQVGGVGLTLTSADRAIIYDPSWNPADDAQAIDRIYRIGQRKNVVVYRLITCGTLEEKIFRRQVFKNSIIKQTNGEMNDPYRYFSNHELRDLFVLDDPRHSATQVQLEELHGKLKLDETAENHLNYLHTLDMFGVSYHELMFSAKADDYDDSLEEEYHNELENRVSAARNRLQQEAIFAGGEPTNEEMRWGGSLDRNTRDKTKATSPMQDITNKIESISVKDEQKPMFSNYFNKTFSRSPEPEIISDEEEVDHKPIMNFKNEQSLMNQSDNVINLLTDSSDSEPDLEDDMPMTKDVNSMRSDESSEDELLEDLMQSKTFKPKHSGVLSNGDTFNESVKNDGPENNLDASVNFSDTSASLHVPQSSGHNVSEPAQISDADKTAYSDKEKDQDSECGSLDEDITDASLDHSTSAANLKSLVQNVSYSENLSMSNADATAFSDEESHNESKEIMLLNKDKAKRNDIFMIDDTLDDSIKSQLEENVSRPPSPSDEETDFSDDEINQESKIEDSHAEDTSYVGVELNHDDEKEKYTSLLDRLHSSTSSAADKTDNSDKIAQESELESSGNVTDASFITSSSSANLKANLSKMIIPESDDESMLDDSRSMVPNSSMIHQQMSSTPNIVNKNIKQFMTSDIDESKLIEANSTMELNFTNDGKVSANAEESNVSEMKLMLSEDDGEEDASF